MTYERDEGYWYASGWPILRGQLVKVCLRHADNLLEELASRERSPEKIGLACEQWFAESSQSIWRNIQARPEAELWKQAIRLLIEPLDLTRIILQDRLFRAQDTRDRHISGLITCLHQHLEWQRKIIQDGSPHRRKVWERLDVISRKINRDGTAYGERCYITHQQKVLETIEREHPKDHNLPHRLETIRTYFLEFCPECKQEFPDGDPAGMNDVELEILSQETDTSPDPMPCLRALSIENPKAAESFLVAKNLQELLPGNERYSSIQAYAVRNSLSKRQLYKRVRQATDFLISCLQRHIKHEMGEP